VTFKDGTTVLATVALDANDHASFTTSALSAGHHYITAAYSGDAHYGAGSMMLIQPVLQTATVVLASGTNPTVYGQSVTFTATVAAGGPTANVPEGSVTFMDGSTVLGTVALNPLGQASSNGQVTFTTAALPAGSHAITAVFSGDTNFAGATSAADAQTVNPAATTAAVASSLNPSKFGQSVTLTATVTVNSPGAGTPAGTVTFLENGATLGTATLDGTGKAALTTIQLLIGTDTITAVYGGASNFGGSTSAALTQTVNIGAPTPPLFRGGVTVSGPLSAAPLAPRLRLGGGIAARAPVSPAVVHFDGLFFGGAPALSVLHPSHPKGWPVFLLDQFFAGWAE
jgi:hypothetical protein